MQQFLSKKADITQLLIRGRYLCKGYSMFHLDLFYEILTEVLQVVVYTCMQKRRTSLVQNTLSTQVSHSHIHTTFFLE